MEASEKYWIEEYTKRGALWIHDGNPKRPHALLTSDKHSNGFFNSELVTQDACLLDGASSALVDALFTERETLEDIDRVVGLAMGAITLAHDICRHIAESTFDREPCLRAYTEKKQATDGSTVMVFVKTRIIPGEDIVLCEDVLSTGKSVDATAAAVTKAGGILLPYVLVLVNRSGLKEVSGKKIIALIDRPMPMWDPDECPLCKEGSEAIRPKENENWARLNAEY